MRNGLKSSKHLQKEGPSNSLRRTALHAALAGSRWEAPSDLEDGTERTSAHFPQEWLRDPSSPYLLDRPVDVPWDDPALVEALLALRPAP